MNDFKSLFFYLFNAFSQKYFISSFKFIQIGTFNLSNIENKNNFYSNLQKLQALKIHRFYKIFFKTNS